MLHPELIGWVSEAATGLFLVAFLESVRKEIGKRDHWTCCDCGRQWQDGWLVDAAHDSDKHGKEHQDPSEGRILCLRCHLLQHIGMEDYNSAFLILQRILKSHGGRHDRS